MPDRKEMSRKFDIMKSILTIALFVLVLIPIGAQIKTTIVIPKEIRDQVASFPSDVQMMGKTVEGDMSCMEYEVFCIDENKNKIVLAYWFADAPFTITKVSEYQTSRAYTERESKQIRKWLKRNER